jgi:hypothetical protein
MHLCRFATLSSPWCLPSTNRYLPPCAAVPLLVAAMFSGGTGITGGGSGGSRHSACHSGDDGEEPGGKEAAQANSSLVALASAVPFLVAAVGMNINARLSSRANERHRHAGVPILCGGLTLGLVPLAARTAGPGLAFALLSAAAGFCWSFHGEFPLRLLLLLAVAEPPPTAAAAAAAAVRFCTTAAVLLSSKPVITAKLLPLVLPYTFGHRAADCQAPTLPTTPPPQAPSSLGQPFSCRQRRLLPALPS